ncbi:hypothetical protein Aple_024160 [Acrocarpospora pleiomorpha]|uniref:Uncharacterized protein n=1 Tax=Acrocarpospora pleiomorpha TaxID=90975 RepID=A0A5M3XEN2_9ACTN|nr:hypothetical protein Aple_024160 [Acrocarpospora pleiomorpha]
MALAALLAGAVAAPAAAVAQPRTPDPARAVQKQLRHGHGVRISELSVLIFGKDYVPSDRMRSQVQLSPTGPVAYDASLYFMPLPDMDQRAIDARDSIAMVDWDDITHVNGVTYLHAEPGSLPAGKSWIRAKPHASYARYFSHQAIDVFDARVLRILLRGATGKAVPGGYAYRGVVTREQLGVAATRHAKDKINWWLWTDAKGLPTRLRTTDFLGGGDLRIGVSFDTRYRDWGFPLVVTAPPADQVIDADDL